LAHHLQRDSIGAVRNFWDFRGVVPPSKVLIKVGTERRGRKPSGRGPTSSSCRGRRRDARRGLGSPPPTRPLGAARIFMATGAWCLLPRFYWKLGLGDPVEKTERMGPRAVIWSSAPHACRALSSQPSAATVLGAARQFWDYRGLMPPSKVLLEIGIERRGRKAGVRGRGSRQALLIFRDTFHDPAGICDDCRRGRPAPVPFRSAPFRPVPASRPLSHDRQHPHLHAHTALGDVDSYPARPG
jgi:hypothetical protein